jgi:hypothetical protein
MARAARPQLAKLSRPRISRALARPRLFAALDRALEARGVWIAGGPGAGKTTLVSTYLDTRKHTVQWYQLDAQDTDVANVFHYLATAVPHSAARARNSLPVFTPDADRDLQAFARRFFRSFFAFAGSPLTLVFDNAHEAASKDLHCLLAVALGEVPLSSSLIVQSNLVGTDATGTVAVGGQTVSGIEVDAGNNTIGGTLAGAGNIVAFNTGAGVRISAGTGSGINGNSIFSNGGLGIALGQAGVPNVNDPGDPDVGANNFQNYPVLTSAIAGAGTVTVSGTLNSNATTAFRLEFFANVACDVSTHGEGQSFIGFANVATDGSGNASFGPLVFGAPAGQAVVTATATDPLNNTSEFSQCLGGGALPTLSINNVSNNEGNSGTTPFTFTVTLSAPSASTVTVNYATSDGTATAGSDYVATSGMLTFAPGITTQPITVLVNGDLVVEPGETFTVTLTTPTNATIATAQGTGTILNDDVAGSPGTLQFSAPTYSVGEGGGSAVITVTRVGGSSGAVSVTAATVGGGTATAGADYTVTSVSLNWPDGDASSKTLVVPIIDDALVEPSETVNLALSAPTGGAALGAQATALLTIIDNDAPPPPPASQVIPTLSWTGLLLLMGLLALGAIVRIRLSHAPRSQTSRRR